jgi:hypothetical protein
LRHQNYVFVEVLSKFGYDLTSGAVFPDGKGVPEFAWTANVDIKFGSFTVHNPFGGHQSTPDKFRSP